MIDPATGHRVVAVGAAPAHACCPDLPGSSGYSLRVSNIAQTVGALLHDHVADQHTDPEGKPGGGIPALRRVQLPSS